MCNAFYGENHSKNGIIPIFWEGNQTVCLFNGCLSSPRFQLHDFLGSVIVQLSNCVHDYNPDQWILLLCHPAQFCIDVMATRSYDSSRTTMCRMRSSTPRHSSPTQDTHVTSGSSCVCLTCPLQCPNFVSSQKPRKTGGWRNRLSSLDCCAFSPPAILSTDEREFKGQPVEAAFIDNLFALVASSLNLLQLITSSSGISQSHGRGLDAQTQGQWPSVLCFHRGSDMKTAQKSIF